MKDQYSYMVANEETMTKIKRYRDTPKKPITNIAFYYILANPYYQREFNYFPVALKDRELYIVEEEQEKDRANNCEQSDFVCFMLNLAYLKKGYAREIQLNKGFHKHVGETSSKYRTISTMRKKKSTLMSSRSCDKDWDSD